jgi:hypothetical protein
VFTLRIVMALFAAGALLGAVTAAAKDFRPGDLSVCNRSHCIPIANRNALHAFSSFFYGNGAVTAARPPRPRAPAFELRVNGAVAGIAASGRLDRALVYGLNCARFHGGQWYRLPARAARELRRRAAPLMPLRVPGTVPRSC